MGSYSSRRILAGTLQTSQNRRCPPPNKSVTLRVDLDYEGNKMLENVKEDTRNEKER